MTDWWSRKLGTEQPSSPTPPVRPPAPVPFNPSQMPGHRMPIQYDQEADVLTTKAQAVKQNQTPCPSCGSGNYMKLSPSPNSPYRCFDCGYPLQQSTSGLGGAVGNNAGPVQPAQQVSTANNYNPNVIQGRIA